VDLTASKTASLLGINRNTINRYFNLFRQKIAVIPHNQKLFSGEVELDESYFGAKRVTKKQLIPAKKLRRNLSVA
jgi:hypothetical protein